MFRGLSPYLYYEDANAALDWLARVFGFQEHRRYVDSDGSVQEAELRAGDAVIMLTGVGEGYWKTQDAPGPVGHLCVVYVDDVDAHYRNAVAAGLTAEPPSDKPYGRSEERRVGKECRSRWSPYH